MIQVLILKLEVIHKFTDQETGSPPGEHIHEKPRERRPQEDAGGRPRHRHGGRQRTTPPEVELHADRRRHRQTRVSHS